MRRRGLFRNKALVSVPYDAASIISYYKMQDNALDTKGVNNGTATNLTYSDGLVGRQGVFSEASSSRIAIPNNASLQLSTGTLICLFNATNSGFSKRALVAKQWAYGLFLYNGKVGTYGWSGTVNWNGDKITDADVNDGLNHVAALAFEFGVTNGIRLFVDGELKLTTQLLINNQNVGVSIGAGRPIGGIEHVNAKIDEVAFANTVWSDGQILNASEKLLSGQSLI